MAHPSWWTSLSRLWTTPDPTRFDAPLLQAVIHNDVPAAQAALEAGANPDLVLGPPHVRVARTLVQHAVLADHIGMLEVLLRHKANPNATTPESWYAPAHSAVIEENAHAAALLHQFGADWRMRVEDPLVREPVSAIELLRLRRPLAFTDWFSEHIVDITPAPHERRVWTDNEAGLEDVAFEREALQASRQRPARPAYRAPTPPKSEAPRARRRRP